MRFYWLEDKFDDFMHWVPWRWLLGPLVAWAVIAKGIEWLVWHGY